MTASAQLPLEGRRIIVTRTRDNAEGIVNLLQATGATVVVVPLIATEPVASPEDIATAAATLSEYSTPRWMVITSAVAARMVLGSISTSALSGTSVAAVGPATAAALREAGMRVDLIASNSSAEALARELVERGVTGAHVWFPSAEGAGATLPALLDAAGADVTRQVIYRTVMPAAAPERLEAALRQPVAAITLTSASTASHLAAALGDRRLPADVVVACIGPQTAEAAQSVGVSVTLVATEHTAAGLVAALEQRLRRGEPVT